MRVSCPTQPGPLLDGSKSSFRARPGAVLLLAAAFGAGGAAFGCGGSDTTGGTTGTCEEAPADNSAFCEGDSVDMPCTAGYPYDVCGVPEKDPDAPIVRSTGLKEFAGSGAPQVDCFAPSGYPSKPGSSKSVKASGYARIFSSGDTSTDLQIEFYNVVRDGSDNDGNIGDLIGTVVMTDSDCSTTGRMQTKDDGTIVTECPYAYDGVPTETELVILTSGSNWQRLYDYNIYIPSPEVSNGVWDHDVRALANDDWGTIPRAAGLSLGITTGHGVLAGEVHDCGDVRLSGAVVNIDQPSQLLTYFSANEDNPLPDTGATSTSVLGLYSALDVAPGPITVAAMGIVDDHRDTLGFFRAYIFPDAATAVTFHGLQPFQVP